MDIGIDYYTLWIQSSKSCSSGSGPRFGYQSFPIRQPTFALHLWQVFSGVSELVQSALDGYHVCLFSYGQVINLWIGACHAKPKS